MALGSFSAFRAWILEVAWVGSVRVRVRVGHDVVVLLIVLRALHIILFVGF